MKERKQGISDKEEQSAFQQRMGVVFVAVISVPLVIQFIEPLIFNTPTSMSCLHNGSGRRQFRRETGHPEPFTFPDFIHFARLPFLRGLFLWTHDPDVFATLRPGGETIEVPAQVRIPIGLEGNRFSIPQQGLGIYGQLSFPLFKNSDSMFWMTTDQFLTFGVYIRVITAHPIENARTTLEKSLQPPYSAGNVPLTRQLLLLIQRQGISSISQIGLHKMEVVPCFVSLCKMHHPLQRLRPRTTVTRTALMNV